MIQGEAEREATGERGESGTADRTAEDDAAGTADADSAERHAREAAVDATGCRFPEICSSWDAFLNRGPD